MSSSIGEQLSKCRELVANNPRPKFHTTNTTQDSRNRERLLNESESKKLFSPGLVDIKNSPRYYKDQVLHLKGLDPVKSEKYLCVLQGVESTVTTRTLGFHLLITEAVRSQTDMTLRLSVLWWTIVDWISTLSRSEDPYTLRKILELRCSHSAWQQALIARSSLLQMLCIRWRTTSGHSYTQVGISSVKLHADAML